jgi:hypothetical protein
VDWNFTVSSRKFIKTDNGRVFVVYTCINWFYSFTNSIETKLEEDYSIASFQQWTAKSNEVLPSLKTITKTYWEKGFKPLLPKLCQPHFQDIYVGGDLAEKNSFTELENAAPKKAPWDQGQINLLIGPMKPSGCMNNEGYQELIPTFVRIPDLVQTAGDLAFVRKEMNQIYSVLLSRKHTAGPAGNMDSLPEVNQQRKDKRMKLMGLPEKR